MMDIYFCLLIALKALVERKDRNHIDKQCMVNQLDCEFNPHLSQTFFQFLDF